MPQLSDDGPVGKLKPLDDALALLAARMRCVVGTETIDLADALGRVLASDIVARHSIPPHDNSAVDGYAIAFHDLKSGEPTQFAIAGRVAAGECLGRPVGPGEAVRIFTGAAMPDGCDTVMMQEDCIEIDGRVVIPPGLRRGANRRHAGEDVAAGQRVLRRGHRLRPQDIGLLAAAGEPRIDVNKPLAVAIFSTGDELREPGEPLLQGAIHDANRYALRALLQRLGCLVEDFGIVADQLAAIREVLRHAALANQLIITSGGMSVGEEDHVKAAIRADGELHVWQLAIKPGRPIGVGEVRGVTFVGLPGNPAAMMITFLRVVRPLIHRLAGALDSEPRRYRIPADFVYKKKAGRREWVRVHLIENDQGVLCARKFSRDGAGILSSLVETDGVLELSEEVTRIEPGMPADFIPYTAFD